MSYNDLATQKTPDAAPVVTPDVATPVIEAPEAAAVAEATAETPVVEQA